jgi:UbiD family decarboxylase
MPPKDLREVLEYLERRGMLAMVKAEVDPHLEVAEIARRVMYRRYPLRCLAYPSISKTGSPTTVK